VAIGERVLCGEGRWSTEACTSWPPTTSWTPTASAGAWRSRHSP